MLFKMAPNLIWIKSRKPEISFSNKENWAYFERRSHQMNTTPRFGDKKQIIRELKELGTWESDRGT